MLQSVKSNYISKEDAVRDTRQICAMTSAGNVAIASGGKIYIYIIAVFMFWLKLHINKKFNKLFNCFFNVMFVF